MDVMDGLFSLSFKNRRFSNPLWWYSLSRGALSTTQPQVLLRKIVQVESARKWNHISWS